MKAPRIRSHPVRTFLAATLLLSCFSIDPLPNQARAQDFLSWIDADSAMVCHVCDPQAVLEYLESFDYFRNPYWDEALKLVTEPNFALLDAEELKAIGDLLTKWKQTFEQIEEVVIVLHKFETTKVEFTCLIRIKDGSDDNFQRLFEETQDRFKSIRDKIEDQEIGSLLKGQELYHADAGNWFLISNTEAPMSGMADRIQGNTTPEFRAMSNSRKYQIVLRTFEQSRLSRAAIRILGNPSELHVFFPNISERGWDELGVNELPSFGSQVFLVPKNNSTSDENITLVVDSHINATLPRSGISLVWECNKAIPYLPPVPDNFISFVATNHDPEKQFDVHSRLYSTRFSVHSSYADWAKDRYRTEWFGDFFNFAEKQTDEVVFTCFFIHESSSNIEALRILPIESNLEAMALKGRFDRHDAGLLEDQDNYRKVDFDFGRLYPVLDGRIPARNLSIYFDDNWAIEGRIDNVKQYVRQLHEEAIANSETKFTHELATLRESVSQTLNPFRIEWSRLRSRLQQADLIESIKRRELGRTFRPRTQDGQPIDWTPETKIRSNAERNLMLRSLLMKGILQSLGTQLTLTSQSDNQIRIVHGLFDQGREAGE